jgi:hypothetical protein
MIMSGIISIEILQISVPSKSDKWILFGTRNPPTYLIIQTNVILHSHNLLEPILHE